MLRCSSLPRTLVKACVLTVFLHFGLGVARAQVPASKAPTGSRRFVLDATTRLPIAGARVTLEGTDASGTIRVNEAETDVDGSLALCLPGVVRGTIRIDAEGYEIGQQVWLPHWPPVDPFILLETGVEIGGQVTTPSVRGICRRFPSLSPPRMN